jgi:hypothetical protein
LRLEKKGPGIAFWRAMQGKGWDVWGYGITIEVDWFRWGLGAKLLDFDMAKGAHFDSFTLIGIRVPFLYLDLSIHDRRN